MKNRLLVGFFLLAILTPVAIWGFYLYADASGAREWEETKKRLVAAGDNLDFNSYIPPKIPDDQNLAAIPLFKLEPDPSDEKKLTPLALNKTVINYRFLQTFNQEFGKFADENNIDKLISEDYKLAFPMAPQDLKPLGKLEVLFPALKELRAETSKRPLCRFERDYATVPPTDSVPEIFSPLYNLSGIILVRTLVAVNENHPDLALDEIKVVLKINGGLRQEPMLMSGMLASDIFQNQMRGIWEGLNRHVWTDSQLNEIQLILNKVDFVADFQLCIRGEATGYDIPYMDYFHNHREDAAALSIHHRLARNIGIYSDPWIWSANKIAFKLLPNGTFDLTKARTVSFIMRAAKEVIDSEAHRIYPEKVNGLKTQIESLSQYSIPNYLIKRCILQGYDFLINFSEAQSLADESIIACALERYRLAHGAYPATLDDLTPYSPKPLPHDIFSGEPYHYKLQPDGKFLLYSVGWNEVDDGGVIAYSVGSTPAIKQGDWVWPCATYIPPK